MSDFRQTRSSVTRWKEILIPTYRELINVGVGDVWVFGSQAMSLYMDRPLASKDLDLLASGMSMQILNRLCEILSPLSPQKKPYFSFQNPEHEGTPNPVFSVYLVDHAGKPFAVELFQTYNGHDLRELTPYANLVERWDNSFQTLSVEAIIATRLAFRPPDRITPFNAERLNRFVRTVRKKIDWNKVERFAVKFELEDRIAKNLKLLRQRRIAILDSTKLSFL